MKSLGNNYLEGPSPRMRGKLVLVLDAEEPARSIPAYAGKTLGVPDPRLHLDGPSPRMRGKLIAARAGRKVVGPSPRMRGKLPPARPGSYWRSVHPRVCGENEVLEGAAGGVDRSIPAYAGKTHAVRLIKSALDGPSPRMRGKHDRAELVGGGVRSIPAYAGKTITSYLKSSA